MDIDLFVDSVYNGFFPLDIIEERLSDHLNECRENVSQLDVDEILLYAVFTYAAQSEQIISLDLVRLVMTYQEYVRYVAESRTEDSFKRFFFMRNNEGEQYE